MLNLPLNALRAFEVAARTGSFVQAGAELGVTSAAVSQQVKQLEAHYAKQLFVRQGNRIMLTDAGRAIYPRLEAALGEIAAIGAELHEGQGRARLVVSCIPTLAESWLIPRLSGFQAGVGVELRVEEDPVVLARDGVDLRLTYGAHYYGDHRVQSLFRDRIVPVVAPGLAEGLAAGGLAALPDAQFIHTDWGPAYASGPSWASYWRMTSGRRAPDRRGGLAVGQMHLAILAAAAGLGAALVPERIAARPLSDGRLVIAGSTVLDMSWDYMLVWPEALRRRQPLQALIAHLLAAV